MSYLRLARKLVFFIRQPALKSDHTVIENYDSESEFLILRSLCLSVCPKGQLRNIYRHFSSRFGLFLLLLLLLLLLFLFSFFKKKRNNDNNNNNNNNDRISGKGMEAYRCFRPGLGKKRDMDGHKCALRDIAMSWPLDMHTLCMWCDWSFV